jgi:hypothetical protein
MIGDWFVIWRDNPPETMQRMNIPPDISVGDDNWDVMTAKRWLIANAERDQLTGSIIPGQAFRHPDGTIMTVRSPIDGMRIFELCSYCYCACKASSMERHVKNCRGNPEPPLTVSASGGSPKRRNTKSNAKGEKKRKGNAAESTKTPSE